MDTDPTFQVEHVDIDDSEWLDCTVVRYRHASKQSVRVRMNLNESPDTALVDAIGLDVERLRYRGWGIGDATHDALWAAVHDATWELDGIGIV